LSEEHFPFFDANTARFLRAFSKEQNAVHTLLFHLKSYVTISYKLQERKHNP